MVCVSCRFGYPEPNDDGYYCEAKDDVFKCKAQCDSWGCKISKIGTSEEFEHTMNRTYPNGPIFRYGLNFHLNDEHKMIEGQRYLIIYEASGVISWDVIKYRFEFERNIEFSGGKILAMAILPDPGKVMKNLRNWQRISATEDGNMYEQDQV